jgi:hypothetical protein
VGSKATWPRTVDRNRSRMPMRAQSSKFQLRSRLRAREKNKHLGNGKTPKIVMGSLLTQNTVAPQFHIDVV